MRDRTGGSAFDGWRAVRRARGRLARSIRRYGLLGLPRRVAVLARRTVLDADTLIFRCAQPLPNVQESRDGLAVSGYTTASPPPAPVVEAIAGTEGRSTLETVLQEVRRGRTLWVTAAEGAVTGYLLAVRARALDSWYVPVEDDDLIIHSLCVFPAWRDREVGRMLLAHVVGSELTGRQSAYLDIQGWNARSRRCAEASGFRQVPTHELSKPIEKVG